jgi:hypothetical protein
MKKRMLVATLAAGALAVAGPALAAGHPQQMMDMNKIASRNDAAHTITLRDGKTFIVPANLSMGEYQGYWTEFLYHKTPDGKLVLDEYFVDGS